MARKKKKNPVVRFLKSVVSFFKDDRLRYALGIVCLLAGLFMVLVLISYLINWKTDQDFEWARVWSGPEIQVENAGGKRKDPETGKVKYRTEKASFSKKKAQKMWQAKVDAFQEKEKSGREAARYFYRLILLFFKHQRICQQLTHGLYFNTKLILMI